MTQRRNPEIDPLHAICATEEGAVLAVIVGVDGPSYRPVGAVMAIFADGGRVGSLSSGCIESDLTLHAAECLASGKPMSVRYGLNSPFRDIELPCGGGLDILLLPAPDQSVLAAVLTDETARRACALVVDPESGAIRHSGDEQTGWCDGCFIRRVAPELRFLVFGKGPESSTFSALVQSADFPVLLLSPDSETLERGATEKCETRLIVSPTWPADIATDPWTAVVLFFHDHEWEPPILAAALAGPAFYVGAQGSQRARDARHAALAAASVPSAHIAKLRGPIGLIASTRDPRTLAVSVLAEVLAVAMEQNP